MATRTFRFPFDNVFHVIIPGTVHQLGTSKLIYQAYDDSTPPKELFGVPRIDPISTDFDLNFVVPYTGIVILTAEDEAI